MVSPFSLNKLIINQLYNFNPDTDKSIIASMNYHQDTEYITNGTVNNENIASTEDQSIIKKEKSIFEDPIFYATLIIVGIAGFFATRKAHHSIQRNRLRASRRFQGIDYAQRNGHYSWEEEEYGIGS